MRFKEDERNEPLSDRIRGAADKARDKAQRAADDIADKANLDKVTTQVIPVHNNSQPAHQIVKDCGIPVIGLS
jgi:hypothetical protein